MEKSFRVATLALLLGGSICMAGAAAAETKKCPGLRALNGECANPLTVADAQSRAMIISTVRVSYYGTPIGDIGGPFIPFDKQFQNSPNNLNSLIFGLPTYTYFTPGGGGSIPFIINRTK